MINKSPYTEQSSELDLLEQLFDDAVDIKQNVEKAKLCDTLEELDERYTKMEPLGEGMVKRVYRAYDHMMDREVAYAEMRVQVPELVDDFLKEARLTSLLEHPNIAPVYDMGIIDGQPFFVMKLYEGRSLPDELIRKQKVAPQERISWSLNIFIKLCEAVSFAHSQGILHLDIKPSNIRINNYGEVLLCDWGIARFVDSFECLGQMPEQEFNAESIISRATVVGELHGTPGFMAPEQKKRDGVCDQHTDVYGLGATLFDMLTGLPPEECTDPENVDLPHAVKAICMKAVAEQPADRYQNVKALLADINNYQAGLITSAEDADLLRMLKVWLSRHKHLVTLLVVNFCIIILGTISYIRSIQRSEARLQQSVDELNGEKEAKHLYRLNQAQQLFDQALAAAKAGNTKFDFDPRDIRQAKELAIRALELNPELHLCRGLLGELRIQQGEYQQAVDDFFRAGELFVLYYRVFKKFLDETPANENNYTEKLRLIEAAHTIKRTLPKSYIGSRNRLRNHLIFSSTHQWEYKDGIFDYCMGIMKIVNNSSDLRWDFDRDKNALGLAHNSQLDILSPLRRIRFNELNLSHTNVASYELHTIRWMPLTKLDISYSKVKSLKYYFNKEVREFNMEGCEINDLSGLGGSKVEVLNIFRCPVQLKSLKSCLNLKKVICSQDQAEVLANLLPSSATLQIKK